MSKHLDYNLTEKQFENVQKVLQVTECQVCGEQSIMDMFWDDGYHSNNCKGRKITVGLFTPMTYDDIIEFAKELDTDEL